jgi:hypothetical protein
MGLVSTSCADVKRTLRASFTFLTHLHGVKNSSFTFLILEEITCFDFSITPNILFKLNTIIIYNKMDLNLSKCC